MADNAAMSIQPDEVLEVTRQLDELAARVERVMADEAINLTVAASARDEVSARIASTLNEVHASFRTTAEQGFGEIREIAATMRGHSNNIAAADQDFIS